MLKQKKRRTQPYRASDGDIATLLEFGYNILPRIDADFMVSLPENVVVKKSEQYEYDIMTCSYGSPAKAYEASGETERAIEFHNKTVETSPNRGGYFHYIGVDFTDEAKKALVRLKK